MQGKTKTPTGAVSILLLRQACPCCERDATVMFDISLGTRVQYGSVDYGRRECALSFSCAMCDHKAPWVVIEDARALDLIRNVYAQASRWPHDAMVELRYVLGLTPKLKPLWIVFQLLGERKRR